MALPTRLPVARNPDPLRAPTLRWGILGPGWIAQRFVASVKEHTQQNIVAVGNIDLAGARAFAERFGIPRAWGSSEELINDPNVDVVYISTPHHLHLPCALAAMRAGKHVLVEKPLALNAREVSLLRDTAQSCHVFLMEAMWTWFLPKFDVLSQLLEARVIGEIRSIVADHGEHFNPDHRIMRADMAGGPLLDLGSYPVAFATKLLGPAKSVLASGQQAPTGVNGQASIILTHQDDNQSVLHTTLLSHTPGAATIAGTEGFIVLDGMFYTPGSFHVYDNDKHVIHYEEPKYAYDHIYHEAVHLAYCIGQGLTESPLRSIEDSLITMQTIDEVRRQLGIVFDQER
ncbi:Gfo/Idh/MocA family oxidoreductase [Sodalis sp. dw_96]|uniref:Gfo/Idh/MocA family protein n=1 Tax=Sodalis sp. dw_96 TaxID=2719794 RepID=UPI001BD6A56C|nr:Gfo/Idh/MocA family oxidoreductase [Sodalis sp. dw_96]